MSAISSDVDRLKAAARGRWPEVIVAVGGVDSSLLDGKHHGCPICGGVDRFRLIDSDAGAVLCNRCFSKKNGDGLAAIGWLTGKSFPEVLQSVGDYLGIAQANGKSGRKGITFDQIEFLSGDELLEFRAETWAKTKPPITIDAIVAAGGKPVMFWGFSCIAFHARRDLRIKNGEPDGIVVYRTNGQPFPATKHLRERKTHCVGGSKDGWVIVGSFDRISSATAAWKCEGIPDALAMSALVPADQIVVSNIMGAKSAAKCPIGSFKDKRVYTVADADQPGVEGAERFAAKVASVASESWIVRLPYPVTENNGKDVRDFIIDGHSFDELLQLSVEWKPNNVAADPAAPQKTSPQNRVNCSVPLEEDDDPHRLARVCLSDMPELRTYRSQFYEWQDPAYRILPDDELRSKATASIKAEFDRLNILALKDWMPKNPDDEPPNVAKVTKALVGNVTQAIQSITVTASSTELPAWINVDPPFPADQCIVTSSGILHLPSLVSGKPSLIDQTPDLFTTIAANYQFDPKAGCPQWQKFLAELWPDDSSSIKTLQEIMGYLLLPDTSQQKLFMFIGPKRSGKGTIARVIRQVVGPENIAAPTLGSLQGEFGMQPLLGKTVAIIGDARLSGRTDSAVIVERLLSISGEDAQTVNRKHKPQVTTQLKVRFVLISNELPKLYDASATLPSRMILLRMRRSWYGQEDHALTNRLLSELPGILNWSILGWQRLQERGYFVQPEESQELIATMVDIASPITSFIEDCCTIGAGFQVTVAHLFEAWKTWCEQKGRKPGNEQTLGRDLSAAAPSVVVRRLRENNLRLRVYEGIKLLP